MKEVITVIFTMGAPGAGKTTWAQEQVAKKPKSTVVIARDDIRASLSGGEYKYNSGLESLVTNVQQGAIRAAMQNRRIATIIIGDTNLNGSTRNRLMQFIKSTAIDLSDDSIVLEVEFEEKLFDVDWVTLVERNKVRGKKAVPMPVLRDMYTRMKSYLGEQKHYIPSGTKPKAVIFDIDGTLANNDHRSPFDLTSCGDDTPREAVVKLFKMYKAAGYTVLCVSGRHAGTKAEPTKYVDITQAWLEKHDIKPHALITRQVGDSRKDDIIKEEIFWNHIAPNFDVEVAVDDRSRVVEMWRRIGLDCFQVDFGEF